MTSIAAGGIRPIKDRFSISANGIKPVEGRQVSISANGIKPIEARSRGRRRRSRRGRMRE